MTRLFHFTLAAALVAVPASAQRGPATRATTLPADVLALACAPSVTYEPPPMPLRVTGGQESAIRRSFFPGDLITLNAGTQNGIEVGQEFYARRVQTQNNARVSPSRPGVIRTTGWIRVYAVDETMSLATITHACDSVETGDYLETFALPAVPVVAADTPEAERDNYARILVGNDRRASFGKGDFFVIDRGRDHAIAPGARFVIYRDRQIAENFMFELGEAVAVDVKESSSTLWVTLSRDALAPGDFVAIRK